ncbi:UNVERIFIED_CONTAM: hypothetical protein FKN15_026823 [Acipenser sinensis]
MERYESWLREPQWIKAECNTAERGDEEWCVYCLCYGHEEESCPEAEMDLEWGEPEGPVPRRWEPKSPTPLRQAPLSFSVTDATAGRPCTPANYTAGELLGSLPLGTRDVEWVQSLRAAEPATPGKASSPSPSPSFLEQPA